MIAAILLLVSACDVNADGVLNVLDVAIAHRQVLGEALLTADLNNDAIVNVIDLQRVVTAALGGVCVAVPSMPRFSWTNGTKSCVSVYSPAPFPPGGSPWVATCR